MAVLVKFRKVVALTYHAVLFLQFDTGESFALEAREERDTLTLWERIEDFVALRTCVSRLKLPVTQSKYRRSEM